MIRINIKSYKYDFIFEKAIRINANLHTKVYITDRIL